LLDLCIIGLGNPGDKHFKTRHNAGYDYLEKLCNDLGVVLAPNKKLDGHYGEAVINDLKIGFLKPNEYINNSGKSVLLVKKYHVKNLTDILVIHDDMDLEPGEVKLKEGGGHGGHNGLKDIIAKAGKDFVRLRFGIGHPPTKQETNAWVIKKPNPQEKQGLEESFAKADFARDYLLGKKWLIAMNELHKK
jgi:PTH1 family peptidyl-tRNA hydrolase